jgi:hypothetical protein
VFTPGHTGSNVLVRLRPNETGGPNAVAVAVGSDRQAIAYRSGADLFVQPVDSNGAALGTSILVAHGEVGAPAIAFRGPNLIVVWAQRANASSPYTLRSVEWDPTRGAPPASSQFAAATATDSIVAPSVSTDGDRVLLAWTEGDTARHGIVRVASGAGALPLVIASATAVTPSDANARDPEVALTSERAWITWQHFTRAHPRGERRVAQLRCDS